MLETMKLARGVSFDVEFLDINAVPEFDTPHRHEYFEIFWVVAGSGMQSIDFVEYEMTPGQIFFITPGQVHHVTELPDNLYAISFNAEFIDSNSLSRLPIDKLFLQNRSQKPYIELDSTGDENLRHLIRIIEQELLFEAPDRDLMSNLLVSFLRYVMRYLDGGVQSYSHKDPRMVSILKLIDQHFANRKDTGFYAEKLAMTYKRLNELTKQQFGKTVTQLLHDKVIVEARRQLVYTNKTVKTIGFELGYLDTSYFCRFFKRVTGESPQLFRDNNRS